METKSIFKTLSTLDVNKSIKAIQGSKYLPWNKAWGELCKIYPDAKYEFLENEVGLPYFESHLGLFVKTSVTINNITHKMVRPVYDFRNLAMKSQSYEVQYGKKKVVVNAATANDINDSLMRCLTKNIAMFGLGIYIFQGEEFADLELISSDQISEISNLIAKHKLMLGDLNAVFGINRLSELASFNYENALGWIKDNAPKS